MIDAINIIHKSSGLSVYNKTFGSLLKVNETLFSGFITALQLLIDEISHKSIDEVKLGDYTLILVDDNVLTVSALIDEMESVVNIRKKISLLLNEIYKVYPRDKLKQWNGDMKKVNFVNALVLQIFNNKHNMRIETIVQHLERLSEMTGVRYYGVLTREGELIYSSTDNKRINALILKSFDSLATHVSILEGLSSTDRQKETNLKLVSSEMGTIIFSSVNSKYMIFVINSDEDRLGLTLVSVEKIVKRIDYTLGIEKIKNTQKVDSPNTPFAIIKRKTKM